MLIFDQQNFEREVLKSSQPVLVDFFASWCQPCQVAAPILEELAQEYEGKISFGKVDVEVNPQLAAKYQTMSIPTLIFFKNGQEVSRLVGFEGKEAYKQFIDKCLT
jgi:thioredoxin 1